MTDANDQIPEKAEMGKHDPHTGVRWVHVTPEMARAHPKYRLNGILWGFVAVILLSGVLKMWIAATAGAPLWLTLGSGLVSFVIGSLLAMKSPWAMVATVVLIVFQIFSVVSSLQTDLQYSSGFGGIVYLAEIGLLIFMAIYLLESDRANLIYRHRYRKYSDLTRDD